MAHAISNAISSVGQGIGGIAANAQANKIGAATFNTGVNAPRAGFVGPGTASPSSIAAMNLAGTPTSGTNPLFTPGTGQQGLKFAVEQQKERQLQQRQGFQDALTQANTGKALAETAAIPGTRQSELALRQAQTAEAKARTAKLTNPPPNPKLADSPQKIAAEIDAQFPKVNIDGTTEKSGQAFLSAYQNKTGSYGEIENGKWVTKADGSLFTANPAAQGFGTTLDETEATPYMPATRLQEYGNRLMRAGAASAPGQPQPGQQPAAPAGGTGPVRVSSRQEALQLPPNTQFIGPDGKTYWSQGSQGQGQ